MNFELSQDQNEIKATARDLLTTRFKPERLRELAEAETYDDAVMTEVIELGWPAIAVPEEDGGVGHLALMVDDLDETYARLREASVRFVNPPVEIDAGANRGARAGYLRDPDGITIELVQPAPGPR